MMWYFDTVTLNTTQTKCLYLLVFKDGMRCRLDLVPLTSQTRFVPFCIVVLCCVTLATWKKRQKNVPTWDKSLLHHPAYIPENIHMLLRLPLLACVRFRTEPHGHDGGLRAVSNQKNTCLHIHANKKEKSYECYGGTHRFGGQMSFFCVQIICNTPKKKKKKYEYGKKKKLSHAKTKNKENAFFCFFVIQQEAIFGPKNKFPLELRVGHLFFVLLHIIWTRFFFFFFVTAL